MDAKVMTFNFSGVEAGISLAKSMRKLLVACLLVSPGPQQP